MHGNLAAASRQGGADAVIKWARQAAMLVASLTALGCSGGAAPAGPVIDQPQGILHRELAQLPKVGDYQPPLDAYRLEVAPPAGWKVIKGRTFLMGFKPLERELPRITISAQDPPAGSPAELTEEDAPALALKLDQELRKAVAEKAKYVEEYSLPIVLGETVYIRHVRRAQSGGANCIVQSLATIKNSRMYTVDLIVEIDAPQASQYEASLLNYRDYGYAVAGHMRFALPGEKFNPLAGVKATPPADAKTTAPPPSAAKPKAAEPAKDKSKKPEKTTEKKPA